jgi:dihydroflavonol-4-reductase
MTQFITQKYYLVTGAAGYLGLTVTKQLVRQGAKVRAFILANDPARKYLPAEVEVYEGDLTQKASLEAFFQLPEGSEAYVLHIASIVSSKPEWSQKVIDVNVGGTRNIIDFCPGWKAYFTSRSAKEQKQLREKYNFTKYQK